jgi:hypothetical protein
VAKNTTRAREREKARLGRLQSLTILPCNKRMESNSYLQDKIYETE